MELRTQFYNDTCPKQRSTQINELINTNFLRVNRLLLN